MKNKIFILTLLIIVFYISCNKSKKIDFAIKKISLTESNLDKGIRYSDIFTKIKYIKLKSDTGYLIGGIDKIIYFENKYFILDERISKTIFCFDSIGNFVFKIDNFGKGPGYYLNITDITIDSELKRVVVLDARTHKIIKYNFKGEFVDEIKNKTPAIDFCYLPNDKYCISRYYFINPHIKTNIFPSVSIINEKGNILYNSVFFDSRKFHPEVLPAHASAFSNITKDTLGFNISFNDTIYHITKNKTVPSYYVEFGKFKIDEKFWKYIFNKNKYKDVEQFFTGNNYCRIMQYLESSKYIYVNYRKGRNVFIAIYSKKTNKIKHFLSASSQEILGFKMNDIDGSSIFVPRVLHDDKFLCIINPSFIKKNIHDKSKIVEIIKNSSEYDNPIVAEFVIQPF